MDAKKYLQAKKEGYTLKNRVSMTIKNNNNSADFIAPGFAIGCTAACTYCYVARHRDFGNPLHIYKNTNEIIDAIIDHHAYQPAKYPTYSNQQDRWQWTYDIGESTDLMSSVMIDLTNVVVRQIVLRSDAKPTFATKLCTPHTASLLDALARPYRARVRASLMPQRIADIVEVGTASMKDRILAMKILEEKHYETHINFSPVILYDGWLKDYVELFKMIDQTLGSDYWGRKVKSQLKCEVIMLLHTESLHKSNLSWNPEAEKLLWVPSKQESKTNSRGQDDIKRYQMQLKKDAIQVFKAALAKYLPYCKIRYIF